ncbi:MAG: MATE family efflux transporter [Kiritimatiellae bacterium]|nr:MATE family efflux transporter [Kiritimatiellia bacterium]
MQQRNINDLTTGPILKSLMKLAGPMFAGAMLQNFQSLINLFWVGKLGSDAVAALAMSGTILMLLFPIVMGAATGTVAMVSRFAGAGQLDEASDTAGQSLLVALLIGVATGVIGWFFAGDLCRLLGADETVTRLARDYLDISFIGCFTVFVLFIGNSALQGVGNTMLPMFAMLLANVINIVLDPVLIYGLLGFPRLEVRGAAWATVISQAIAASLVVGYLLRGVSGLHVRASQWRLQPTLVWTLMRIGIPSSGQMLSRGLMALILMRIVALCGTAAIAGYGIGLRFHMIILMPAFVLGNAAATMVGQNLGAGRPDRSRSAAWLATGMDVAIMAISAAVIIVFAPPFVRLFDDNPEVVSVGANYLRTVSPFYIFVALAIVLGRALDGAGQTMATMIFTVISLWGLQVPLAFFLSRIIHPATQGIWWAIGIAIMVHALLVTGWFLTGRWKTHPIGVLRLPV